MQKGLFKSGIYFLNKWNILTMLNKGIIQWFSFNVTTRSRNEMAFNRWNNMGEKSCFHYLCMQETSFLMKTHWVGGWVQKPFFFIHACSTTCNKNVKWLRNWTTKYLLAWGGKQLNHSALYPLFESYCFEQQVGVFK